MGEFELVGQLMGIDIIWWDSFSLMERLDTTKTYGLVLIKHPDCDAMAWRVAEITEPTVFLDEEPCL